MSDSLIEAQDIFLSRVNQLCNKFGLNNIMAQLYAILYLSGKPLSLDDMVERLKVSKGSISTNIRALERYGAVRRIWVKGSRKDYYEAEADITKVIMDRVKSMAELRLSEIDDMFLSSFSALNAVSSFNKEDKESLRICRERLEKLKSLQGKAKFAFNLFNSNLLQNMLNGSKAKKNTSEEKIAV